MTTPEKELVKRVKRTRDMVAFRDLVLTHQKRLYYLIRKTVHNHEDSEDILQETFIKSLKNIDQLKDERKFGSWISSIAVNLSVDFMRNRINREKVSINGDVPPEVLSEKFVDTKGGEKPIDNLYGKEIRNCLDHALMKLPENCCEAFVMFHINGIPVKEIAEIMDSPENTVRSYIFRAVKKLRVELKPLMNSAGSES